MNTRTSGQHGWGRTGASKTRSFSHTPSLTRKGKSKRFGKIKKSNNDSHRNSNFKHWGFKKKGSSFKKRSGPSKHGANRGRGGRRMPTFDPSYFINKNPVQSKPEVYIAKYKFSSFGLDPKIVRTINGMGFTAPTPIQDQIIPEILLGKDVIGLAETGTGKTAAFLLPLINKIIKDKKRQALILTPTRELAIQIDDELKKLSAGLNIYSTVCVGGINIGPQIKSLRRTNHFIIGTPGRIIDLIERKSIQPQRMTTVVLDEADRMLDMGFINDMRKILSKTPSDRETLFFSATMPQDIRQLVHDFLRDPVTISVKKRDIANTIEQGIVPYEHPNKFEILLDLFKSPEFKRVLVFGAMKYSVQKLAQQLSKNGIRADSIHGNKSHGQRQSALKKFKNGYTRVLVATDVAARGIHVENVTHVINYDLPHSFEDYVHRIGRTGRAEKKGKALTFVA